MNVSVVVTVLNEEGTILPLLRSLYKQSFLPSELIIVDGGSSDQTVSIIKEFAGKHRKFPIVLLEESGNISHGRNIGISKAQSEIIALTDAGCTALSDWLKKITSPFVDKGVRVVAGFYKMKTKTAFQEAVAPFHGITLRKLDPRTFMPSARSLAFRKDVWSEVGGFSETLVRAGEDTLFNYAILKKKINIVRVPEALVVWEVPKTLQATAKKFYWYALGDAQSGVWWHPAQKFNTHNIKIMTVFARYLVFGLLLYAGLFINSLFLLMFVVAACFYMAWSSQKIERDVSGVSGLLIIPAIQIISDICVMAGFVSGIITNELQRKGFKRSAVDRWV